MSRVSGQQSQVPNNIDEQKISQQLSLLSKLSKAVINKKKNAQKYSFQYLGILNITRSEINAIFSSIRFIMIMGPQSRAEQIAKNCCDKLNISKNYQKIGDSEFFSIYKIGCVLSCSHGMGLSSVCLFLNELLRIMHISQNNKYELIRLGSSGGIGVTGGTLIVSTHALDPVTLSPEWSYYSCGRLIKHECIFNQDIYKKLYAISKAKKYKVEYGKTVSTETYYESQARLDGALCEYSDKDKDDYLQTLYKNGVRNFEMEGTVVAAMCARNNIKCGMIAVAYLDRLKEDTVSNIHTPQELKSWMTNAIDVVLQYIHQFILQT